LFGPSPTLGSSEGAVEGELLVDGGVGVVGGDEEGGGLKGADG